jgi:GNAT superfamily N-acetyltransferase
MEAVEVIIRNYAEPDSGQVGRLIADTYSEFNLAFASEADRAAFLGPFRHAHSEEREHQEAIAAVLWSEMVYVAEDGSEIVGVLRGRPGRLGSLFVRGDYHRRGIGRMLVAHFEQELVRRHGEQVVHVAATLYAVPFYLAMGYKRSTGVRQGWSFEGHGLPIQPMRKVLRKD